MNRHSLSFGETVRLVGKRELNQRLDRGFFISTAVTIVILVAVIVVPRMINFGSDSATLGVVDATPELRTALTAQAEIVDLELEMVELPAAEAVEQLRGGDLDAYLDGDAVHVERDLSGSLRPVLDNAAITAATERTLTDAGVDPQVLLDAVADATLEVVPLETGDEDRSTRTLVAFIASIVLFGQLIGYSMWVAMGVVEEKSSRVIEVILSAVPTRALLAGKILGIGALAFTQLLAIAVIAVAVALGTGAIPLQLDMVAPIGLALGWFVLGYAFYACIAAAAGARISRQEELQNVTSPITTLTMLSYFGSFLAFMSENNPLVNVLSLVPPFSALMMPIRMARGDAAVWEWSLALVLMLITIVALVMVAARIYDNSVLRMGAKLSWRQAWGRAAS